MRPLAMIGRPSRITGAPIGGYAGGIRIIPIIRVGMIFPVQLLLCSLDIGLCGGTPRMSYKVRSLSAICSAFISAQRLGRAA